MAMLLRLKGYEVLSAASHDETLLHIKVHGPRPDVHIFEFQYILDEVSVGLRIPRINDDVPTIDHRSAPQG
jgi:hypothetical protein